jgi:hypothetical protein
MIYKAVGVLFAALTVLGMSFGVTAQVAPDAAAQQIMSTQQRKSLANAPLAAVTYRIAIKTGDMDDAGTDSTVNLRLCGTGGCSPSRSVEDPNKDDREQGQTDYHYRSWEDVGTLTHIFIYQNTDGSAWNLDWVEVTYSGRTATFPYDNWMPRGQWVRVN